MHLTDKRYKRHCTGLSKLKEAGRIWWILLEFDRLDNAMHDRICGKVAIG